MTAEPGPDTVELLDRTWETIAGLCAGLDEAGFQTPTNGVRRGGAPVGRAARGRPDGTRVETAVTGPLGGAWVVGVAGGRGAFSDEGGPLDAGLRMDLETFLRLVWGRVSLEHEERGGRLLLRGDLDLGRRVAGGLVGVP